MSAYDAVRFDDYRQRLAKGEALLAWEERAFDRLCLQAEAEREAEGPPRWLGGDYPDL